MALLLIEDDVLLARSLETLLLTHDEQLKVITRGDHACDHLATPGQFDLIVLDLNLPHRSGLEVLTTLRQHDVQTPVLILTARASIEDRVAGLDLGADDYLTKPFSLDEFEARVRALLRRARPTAPDTIRLGQLALHVSTQRLELKGTALALPTREQRLLACLLRRSEQIISRAELMADTFGDDETPGDNALEVYVHRLRRRLDGSDLRIRTVRGMGYRLEQH
ncbi:two-component system, OmpR family, response regulator TctD [Kushneria avicenniae]|uniref:Two-component system, OmpR family, response regulator TctD n=1 Tax=Kushneria avicenniae TaxID=402385 RepID=A0A1I1IKB6_9GAMM|nr:response regulator transcription factor [Kushneria avicenniae]SFC36401.1 two-component system, OmpR family, response regulator TctD [Kushneria avicenniae]